MNILKTLALGLCLLPIAASAQTNVKNAFDLLVSNPKAEIIQNHSLERDPVTGEKKSQCDIYSFTLSKKQLQLVKDIEKAFLQDSERAYNYVTGQRTKNSDSRLVVIAVGNGSEPGVSIGREPGMNYVYACFLAPEDTAWAHRYAYAMEWKPTGNGEFIIGKLAVTYATTQSYRQERATAGGLESLKSLDDAKNLLGINISSNGRVTFSSTKTWFETLSSYITAMSTADMQSRRAFASKIYSHTKNVKEADETDIATARKLLEGIKEDKMRYDDSMIQELLAAAIKNLK